MPRNDKNKKQLKPRKSLPKAKHAVSKKPAKIAVVAAVLSPEKLRDLYATMLKCRMLNEKVRSTWPQGNLVTRAAGVEREAVLAGAIAHVVPGDETVTAENGFLAAFIRGAHLTSILPQLLAPANGLDVAPAG